MLNKWLAIKQLDKQFKDWQYVSKKYGKPRVGWVKTIRTALNMTTEQLGKKIGVKNGRISQLEAAEIEDTVTLKALRNAAEGLNCELVYAIMPKNNLTLEQMIRTRAEKVSARKIAIIAHMMSLEAQSLSKDALAEQKTELEKSLMESISKDLWNEQVSDTQLAQNSAQILKKEK